MAKSKFKQRFYVHTVTSLALVAGATDAITVNIEADAHFLLQKMSYMADITAAGQTDSSRVLPLVTMQITDTGSGRQMFDDFVPIPALMGTGAIPFILPTPHKFVANSTFTVQLINYDAANPYNLRLAFAGVKVWV